MLGMNEEETKIFTARRLELKKQGDIFRKQYYKEHKYCPECGSDNVWQTYMGIMLDLSNMDKYEDINEATCEVCNWQGTVHNMVGEI